LDFIFRKLFIGQTTPELNFYNIFLSRLRKEKSEVKEKQEKEEYWVYEAAMEVIMEKTVN